MKILYISKSIIPSRTANSIHVMKMCQAFSDNGHEIILLAPNLKRQHKKNINNIHNYYGVKKNFKIKKLFHPNIIGGSIFYILSIFFYLIINKKFDLVYGRFLYGVYIAALLKNRVIYESHAPSFNQKKYRKIFFEKLIKNKYFIKMVVISEVLKNIYLINGYLNKSKIQVAHDGADEVKNFSSKANLLGKKNNLKVGYVGHLYKGKGMEVISSIANQLDNDIEIHIIGGLDKDIKFWKKKIINKNIFFYGFIPHKKISRYLNSLDICLLPNQKIIYAYGSDMIKNNLNISSFTSPLKLFEYMAHKKPIISSDLPVLREVLNEKNSILVNCEDSKMWLSSIIKLKKLKYRTSIANQAFSDFSNYTWKNRALLVINKN